MNYTSPQVLALWCSSSSLWHGQSTFVGYCYRWPLGGGKCVIALVIGRHWTCQTHTTLIALAVVLIMIVVVRMVVRLVGLIAKQCQVAFIEWRNQLHMAMGVHLKRAPDGCGSRVAGDESFLAISFVVVVVIGSFITVVVATAAMRSALKVGEKFGP
jgi:hypothetical protein